MCYIASLNRRDQRALRSATGTALISLRPALPLCTPARHGWHGWRDMRPLQSVPNSCRPRLAHLARADRHRVAGQTEANDGKQPGHYKTTGRKLWGQPVYFV
jgi:hypothetical protein